MKLIAIDLDGTLLNSSGEVSFESKEYLMKLKRMGYLIVIATGRTLKSALDKTKGAPFACCIISNSGGAVFDNLNKRMLKINSIDSKVASDICHIYDEADGDISYIEINDLEFYNRHSKDVKENNHVKKVDDISNFVENKKDICMISIGFENDKYAKPINKYISKKFESVNSYVVKCCIAKKDYIEILKKDVSKYSAISYVANICGIKNDDIIVFGDSENDLDMVKNSGVGVAMANAVDKLKENAKYITRTNDENGVIEFLKLYLQ